MSNEAPTDDVIRKIQALLAKTVENGCTEEEAASAAAMVQRLLMTYGLSMDQVDNATKEKSAEFDVKSGTHNVKNVHQGQIHWQWRLADCVCKVTCCKFLLNPGRNGRPHQYFFIGTGVNIRVASILFDWLSTQMMELAAIERKRLYDLRNKGGSKYIGKNFFKSFMLGINSRVCTRLEEKFSDLIEELNAGQYILERYDEAEALRAKMAGKSNNLKNRSDVNAGALARGMEAGDRVKLDHEHSIEVGGPKSLGGRS
jgi:hypothetical protein